MMKDVPEMRSSTEKPVVMVRGDGVGEGRDVMTGTGLDENDRRATEIGPVLEEILQTHWEHWGLND